MIGDSNSLDRFKDLLATLFQFDTADLDFGIYRIMNYKRKEIENFIDKDLIQAVEKEFAVYKALSAKELLEEIEEKKKEVQKLEKDLGERILTNGQIQDEFKDKPFAQEYLRLKAQVDDLNVTEGLQAQVFNDLYNFFFRYYEDGDFISKRRYSSKGARYAIPYSGEEVKLYWANFDQYYVKTAEVFKDYEFTSKGWRITFKTSLADVQADNGKSERRYFLLASSHPISHNKHDKSCLLNFEYRPLIDRDLSKYRVKTKSGHEKTTAIRQDDLNSILKGMILEQVKDIELKAILSELQDEKTLLEKHLYKYTRKITSDFFIHKNLKAFLDRELDYFIKTEVVDLNNLESRHITRAKVVQNIAQRIIEFLSQIEEFQKLLWEKKKFVLKTDYVITIDRIPQEFHAEILANKEQLKEWQQLNFGEIKKKQDLDGKKLPVDTKHFNIEFKERLLEKLSERGELDNLIDGVLIKSENWQALNMLLEKYRQKVQCIYIDPPYNTNASPIIYKNGYRDSSWLALMDSRIQLGKTLLRKSGIQCTTIDDVEFHRLHELISLIFGSENIAGVVTIKNNPSGRSTVKGFSIAHEYAIFSFASEESILGMIPRTPQQAAQYNERDEQGLFQWRNFLRSGGANDVRRARPKLHYPLIVSGNTIRLPKLEWNPTRNKWELVERLNKSEQVLLPIASGLEYTWRLGIQSLRERIGDLRVRNTKDGKMLIEIKFRIDEEGILPKTVWDDKYVNATAYGTSLLRHIIGVPQAFSFPKSIYAVKNSLVVCGADPGSIVLDYFAGSGTTAHAVINMNRQDGGKRKYILVEIGDWFQAVLLPRIKKVVFCEKWKDGKPAGDPGISHMLKYHCLEQYEDTLHNIAFLQHEKGQAALNLFGDEYVMKYMLNYETEGSPSLLNLKHFENPFEYKLKIISHGKSEQLVSVDLVETFNYLLGLTVNTYKFLNDNSRKYVVVLGEKRNRRIAIVWRPTKDIDLERDKEVIEKAVADFYPDEIFINGDAYMNYKVIETEFKALMGV